MEATRNIQLRPAEAVLAGILTMFAEALILWVIAHFVFHTNKFDYVVPGAPYTPVWLGGVLFGLGILFFEKTRTMILNLPGNFGRIIFTALFMYGTMLTAAGVILSVIALIHFWNLATQAQAVKLVAGVIFMCMLGYLCVGCLYRNITSPKQQ